jgi:starvation-inducible DNA-binding protein
MEPNIGMGARERENVAAALAKVLADTYTLYLKTHNFHWNVTGPNFPQLHAMFETQYTALSLAVDEIAERIRALGEFAPGSYAEFGKLTELSEAKGRPSAREMVRQLAADNETVGLACGAAIKAAQQAGDEGTADLMIGRQQEHQKAAWMLRVQAE